MHPMHAMLKQTKRLTLNYRHPYNYYMIQNSQCLAMQKLTIFMHVIKPLVYSKAQSIIAWNIQFVHYLAHGWKEQFLLPLPPTIKQNIHFVSITLFTSEGRETSLFDNYFVSITLFTGWSCNIAQHFYWYNFKTLNFEIYEVI